LLLESDRIQTHNPFAAAVNRSHSSRLEGPACFQRARMPPARPLASSFSITERINWCSKTHRHRLINLARSKFDHRKVKSSSDRSTGRDEPQHRK
jgi:hypothetical protein